METKHAWLPYTIYKSITTIKFQMGKEFDEMLQETIEEVSTEPTADDGLGKVKTMSEIKKEKVRESAKEVDKIGYKPVQPEILATKGHFYPPDTTVSVRPASTKEIIHYSSMDESDFRDIGNKITSVVNSCTRIFMNGRKVDCNDLLEVDRLFLFFLIRDYTFSEKENVLNHNAQCPHCGTTEKVEITSNTLGFFDVNDKLLEKWDANDGCFRINHPQLPNMPELYPPTIGTIDWIFDYVQKQELKKQRGEGGFYDTAFLTHLQFLVPDWRQLNDRFLAKTQEMYSKLNHDHISVIRKFIKTLNIGVNTKMERRCGNCSKEYESLVRFPDGGWSSIFDNQNLLGELF